MEIQLNQDLVRRVDNQSMYNRGTNIQNTANSFYHEFVNEFDNASYNENQKKVYEKRKLVFKEFLERSYSEYLNLSSKFVPIMVAGPSNYPVEKQSKIANKLVDKEQEIFNKIDKFYKNTEKMLKEQIPTEDMIKKYRNGYNEPISSDDPHAKEKLEAKLEYLKEKHEKYKEYNKKARKNGERPLPSYVLSNSNQNMKSIKDRLEQLNKIERLDSTGYYFKDGEVRFDKTDNRVKLFFDTKPNEETRNMLKQNGFKWSPSNQAWQRILTPQAISRTKNLFEDIGSLEINKIADYTMKM